MTPLALSLSYSLASCIITANLEGFHALAQYADSSTLALAFVLASINR